MKRCIFSLCFISLAVYGFLFWHFPETKIFTITKSATGSLRSIFTRVLDEINEAKTQKSDKLIVVTTTEPPTGDIKYLANLPESKGVVIGDTKTPNNWTAVDKVNEAKTQKPDKWIVVTTTEPPTEDIKYIANLPGWKVVVIGDTKTPNNWRFQNCDFLSVEQQESLGFRITSLLPMNNYLRKNVGYLYAIAKGAKVIYDTDDGNSPLDELKRFTYTEATGLMYTGEGNTFNSFRHFGQSSMLPRGYPLSQKGSNFSHTYTLGAWRTPLIQQALVNGDPDVIFRCNRKETTVPLNITFSVNSPPVLVREKTFSPFNSQNTLYLYDAFWGLILPTTVSVRVTDIWRSYWSQRLLWEIGGNIAFYPPNAFSKRNRHSYHDDYLQKTDDYFKIENLINFLSDWTCKQEYSFFDCVLDLTSEMIEKEFLRTDDGKLIKLWIEDLKSLKYTEPKRTHMNNMTLNNRKIKGQTADKRNTSVIFAPQNETGNFISLPKDGGYIPDRDIKRVLNYCPHFVFSRDNLSSLSNVKTFNNILLIIAFNFPLYKNVKILDVLYRIHFPNIVYCGIKSAVFKDMTKDLEEPVSFIEVEVDKGYLVQRCVLQAMQMNYGVDGYLYAMDDAILYAKKLAHHRFDKFLISHLALLREDKKPSPPWHWYSSRLGLRAYRKGLNNLNNTDVKAYMRFKENLRINTGFETGFFKRVSDVVYIPAKYSQDFLFYMDIFTRHKLFLEIAFPTVSAGITKMENINYFDDLYLWGGGRKSALKRLAEKKKDFVHPVKMSRMDNYEICEKIIKQNLFD